MTIADNRPPYVKGLNLSLLNRVHKEMLALHVSEHDSLELERIDKVEVVNDYAIHIYTSRFIDLHDPLISSSAPHRHLQIMSTYHLYDNDPDPKLEHMNDPYADYIQPRRYREVYLSSVYRTIEGDEGWIKDVSPTVHEPDTSPLHIWDGTN